MNYNVNMWELAVFFCFFNCSIKDICYPVKLATDVDKCFFRIQCKCAYCNSLDDEMRIKFHNLSVFKCSRLTFVGITYKIYRPWIILREKWPLHTCRETRTSASANSGFLDFGNNIPGLHGESFFQRLVSAVPFVKWKCTAILLCTIVEENSALWHNRHWRIVHWLFSAFKSFDKSISFRDSHIFEITVIDLNYRPCSTWSQILYCTKGKHFVWSSFTRFYSEFFTQMSKNFISSL